MVSCHTRQKLASIKGGRETLASKVIGQPQKGKLGMTYQSEGIILLPRPPKGAHNDDKNVQKIGNPKIIIRCQSCPTQPWSSLILNWLISPTSGIKLSVHLWTLPSALRANYWMFCYPDHNRSVPCNHCCQAQNSTFILPPTIVDQTRAVSRNLITGQSSSLNHPAMRMDMCSR